MHVSCERLWQSLEKDKCKRAIMEEQIQAVQADAIKSRVSSRYSHHCMAYLQLLVFVLAASTTVR